MKSLSGPAVAALNAAELSIVQLVYMDFPGFAIALCSANHPVDYGGVTYRGAAGLGSVGQIDDSPGEVKGLQLELSGVPTEYLALALDDAAIVQGTPLTIRLAVVSTSGQVLDAALDWVGTLDTMTITEDGDTCSIAVTAESSAVDLLRGNSLTTSAADQRSLYPGDPSFDFVALQANQPVIWPTKQLFIAMR